MELAAEERAVVGVPSASTVVFADAICGPKVCSTNRGDFWLYRDGRHLSVPGSLTLSDDFAAAITDAVARAPAPG